MINEGQHNRFKDAAWYGKEQSIIIGGVGGIGSWLAFLLARASFDPIVYDDDLFEEHNMSGQFVAQHQIGKSKVEAVTDNIFAFTGSDISYFNEKYDTSKMGHHYMMSGFDNMKARKDMFEVWKSVASSVNSQGRLSDGSIPLYIDGRLLMEQMQIFCIKPEAAAIKEYEDKHLFDDDAIPEAACSLKQTTHSATMIASLMVGFFTNHLANIANKNNAREVPFMYEYFIPINLSTCQQRHS